MKVAAVAVKLGIPRHHIDYWRKTGLLSGEVIEFADLKKAQFIWECRNRRISLNHVRKMLAAGLLERLRLVESTFGRFFQIQGETFSDWESGQYALQPAAAPEGKLIKLPTRRSEAEKIKNLEEHYASAIEADDTVTVLKTLKTILKLKPDHSGALIERGNIAFDRGKLKQALMYYEQAVNIDPDCVEAVYNTANAYFKLEKYAAAIRHFQECIRLDPDFPESHFNLGVLYLKLGQAHFAKGCFQSYLELDNDSDWADQARQFLEDMEADFVGVRPR